jgi:bifunctional DNA-binding transcriptional regulator/antitoxin component of YhaV-PrlF toxin-antitoxin module
MKELDDFADKNGLMTITPKHVREGEKLRIASKTLHIKDGDESPEALEKLEQESRTHHEDIQKELDYVNDGLNKENEKLVKENKEPLEISPEDYTNFILERLVKKSLITYEEATQLKLKLQNGMLTLDDFARELENIHKVEIHKAISTNAQKFLNAYKTFSPNEVFQYIQESRGLGKDVKDLGQPTIKNLIPAKWIVMVALAGVIVVAVLASVDLTSIGKLIPFFNR